MLRIHLLFPLAYLAAAAFSAFLSAAIFFLCAISSAVGFCVKKRNRDGERGEGQTVRGVLCSQNVQCRLNEKGRERGVRGQPQSEAAIAHQD